MADRACAWRESDERPHTIGKQERPPTVTVWRARSCWRFGWRDRVGASVPGAIALAFEWHHRVGTVLGAVALPVG